MWNVRFGALQRLFGALGFRLARIRGRHHYYVRADLDELVSIQPQGRQAKPYQMRQVALLSERYSLRVEKDE